MIGAARAAVMGAAGNGGGGDEYFANTTLILNHTSDFSDTSNSAHVVSSTGSPSVSSATSPYAGGNSIRMPGGGSYLTLPQTNSATDFGTGDFTIEGWFRSDDCTNQRGILNYSNASTGVAWRYIYQETEALRHWAGPGTSSPTILDNTWYYFAISRTSGNTEIYYATLGDSNATRIANAADTTNFSNAGDYEPYIGTYTNSPIGQNFVGYVAHIRITKGVGRYSGATCPVPTESWPEQ